MGSDPGREHQSATSYDDGSSEASSDGTATVSDDESTGPESDVVVERRQQMIDSIMQSFVTTLNLKIASVKHEKVETRSEAASSERPKRSDAGPEGAATTETSHQQGQQQLQQAQQQDTLQELEDQELPRVTAICSSKNAPPLPF